MHSGYKSFFEGERAGMAGTEVGGGVEASDSIWLITVIGLPTETAPVPNVACTGTSVERINLPLEL